MILSGDLSELIGILLGDGGIFYDKVKHRYLFSVTLNGVDEEIYLIYVIDLIIKIFNKQPAEHWERDKPSAKDDAKGVALIVYGEEIVRQLLKLGLKSGNKVKNQVGVPICIFSSEEISIRCLKGLFDTDGSIYLNKSRKSIYLSFSNSSINLVEGFCKLCDKIGIVSNFYGPYYRKNKKTGKVTRSYSTLILQKEEVKNFLKIVIPEKWKDENRREFIGILIILLKNPTMFNKLIKEHQLKYPTEEFKFSVQNLRFLKDFCKSLKLEINKSLINTEIEESFEFKYLNYSIEFAEYLKELSIEKGSIREVVKAIDKKYRVTSKGYIKRLFSEPEYMELYGNQGYSRWVNHNFEV
ncbi:MAG: hypothetical protein EAX91_11475, partial [Candidatus Lokiarchaeota archaeon]|nr:hypothetical protein [Candidatus Lokiarchaeota archaeon]